MERRDVAEQLSRLRTIRRYYALVVLTAAVVLAASIGSYYSQPDPILAVAAGGER